MQAPVPIPTKAQANFAFLKARSNQFFTKTESQWHVLETDFTKFESLADYIIDAVKRCIDEAFKRGVSVNGKKIKYS